MDWLTFFSKLIDSLVWPAVTLLAIYWLRDAISQRLKGLKRLKWGDKEADFSEELKVAEAVADDVLPKQEPKVIGNDGGEYDAIKKTAETSPRGAVVEAWNLVERAGIECYKRLNPARSGFPDNAYPRLNVIARLFENRVIESDLFEMSERLRHLRNVAVHSNDQLITTKDAIEYVLLAERVVKTLNSITVKPS